MIERAKPILMSTPMVVQLPPKGIKTQTRRVVKCDFHRIYKAACLCGKWYEGYGTAIEEIPDNVIEWYIKTNAKPKYQPGDILWVRETWNEAFKDNACTQHAHYIYRADSPDIDHWKPSIFMPRKAARLFLRVTDVRAERLQEISLEDVIAEGIQDDEFTKPINPNLKGDDLISVHNWRLAYARFLYQKLWDTLNAKRNGGKYAWRNNPWVWVYTFEHIAGKQGH